MLYISFVIEPLHIFSYFRDHEVPPYLFPYHPQPSSIYFLHYLFPSPIVNGTAAPIVKPSYM